MRSLKPLIHNRYKCCNWSEPKDYTWNLVRKFLECQPQNCRVADLACHINMSQIHLARNINYWGFDISASKLIRASKQNPNGVYCKYDMTEKCSILEQQFDGAVSLNTFTHFPPSLYKTALDNIILLVRSNGFLILHMRLNSSVDIESRYDDLRRNFLLVHPIFFNSKISTLNSQHLSTTQNNQYKEDELFNDPRLHDEVLFICQYKTSAPHVTFCKDLQAEFTKNIDDTKSFLDFSPNLNRNSLSIDLTSLGDLHVLMQKSSLVYISNACHDKIRRSLTSHIDDKEICILSEATLSDQIDSSDLSSLIQSLGFNNFSPNHLLIIGINGEFGDASIYQKLANSMPSMNCYNITYINIKAEATNISPVGWSYEE